jgi:transposase
MSDQTKLRQALEGVREHGQLIDIILQQATQIEQLQQQTKILQEQVGALRQDNAKLQQRVDQLESAAARPAAPFRIADKDRLSEPKQPGRKKNHPGSSRPVPPQVDQQITVPLEQCPRCHGPLIGVRPLVQYIEEIPPVRPRVIQLTTYCGHCAQCDQQVRSSHPLQVSLAGGAAAIQLGPNALAVACELNKRHGLPLRKTCAVLKSLFGFSVTPGGLVQAMGRLANRLRPRYEAMLDKLRAGPLMHSDETSWWVGGSGWWLWVFATEQQTVYHVAQGRGRDVLLKVIGQDYEGVLISDCLSIYDQVNRLQHKCYSHHLKAIGQAAEQKPSDYFNQVRGLLHAAMSLKGAGLAQSQVMEHRLALEQNADQLLSLPRSEGLEEKVRRRLWKQRDHLFTFLDHPAVPATNNLAERQLRPAVIARKLSCGNKTESGARTWEVLTSLAATCRQQGQSFLQLIASAVPLPAR